jgi:hypothetical protein
MLTPLLELALMMRLKALPTSPVKLFLVEVVQPPFDRLTPLVDGVMAAFQ